MQEIYESLILLEFPVPKPNVVSRLELEGELGVPDPNDSKEWETLRVAPTDEGTGSEEEEEQQQQEEAAEPDGAELVELDVVLAERAEEGFPQSPFLLSAPSPTLWDPSWEELPARARRRGGGRGGRSRGGRRGRAACGQCPPGGSSSRRPPGTEKPFKCLDCGKGFTRSSNRNAHQQRTHRGQRPPPCPACRPGAPGHGDPGRGAPRPAGEEEQEEERRRAGSSELEVQRRPPPRCPRCPQCGRGGSKPGGGSQPGGSKPGGSKPGGPRCLRQRPYECGHCGRSFSYSSAFLKHQRSHGGGTDSPDRDRPRLRGGCPGNRALSRYRRGCGERPVLSGSSAALAAGRASVLERS